MTSETDVKLAYKSYWVNYSAQDMQMGENTNTTCYFNVRSKADMSQLNLPHGNDN